MAQARAATRAVDNGGESGNVIHPPNQTLGSVSSWMGGGGLHPWLIIEHIRNSQ